MKTKNKRINLIVLNILSSIFFFISCASADNRQTPSETSDKITITKKPATLMQQILLKDRYNGELSSLEKISDNKPVFMEIAASWCPACKEMDSVTAKLYEIFKGKFFFVKVMISHDKESKPESFFRVMEIDSSPDSISIESSQILPRIIIIDKSGELTADISGQYPILYYYGILSEF